MYKKEKDEALQILRDRLSTMYYNQIVKYTSPFERKKDVDQHIEFMDDRMYEYSKAKWKSDYKWDEELFSYKQGDVDLEDVWQEIDKVKITKENVYIFKDILKELHIRKKYNFKDYMNENYRKRY